MQGWFNIKKSISLFLSIYQREKNYIIIFIDTEKSFGKLQLPFLIFKIINKTGTDGCLFNLIKYLPPKQHFAKGEILEASRSSQGQRKNIYCHHYYFSLFQG